VAEVFVKEQINCLRKYFQTIYVISPVAYGMEKLRRNIYENYHYDNVQVFFPKYFNIPLFYIHLRSLWVYLEKKAILKQIKKKRIDFDLIHAHFTWPSGAVAVDLKKSFNVPVLITEHTSKTFNKAIESSNPHFLKAWISCDAVIRVKRSDINKFHEVGLDLSKVQYIPNGYDNTLFHPIDAIFCRSKLNIPYDKKVVLNVANLYSEVKGHRYLIEAMANIVQKRDDVVCYIVGEGKLESKLKKMIEKSNLQNFVKLVGSRQHDEIPIWMNACDVFVLPSLQESFGIVQVEAMGCGKPVVSTYNGGSEEIIISEDYGFLVEVQNSIELSRKIISALDKDWDYDAIRRFAEKYSWDNISIIVQKLYSNLLK
jgi:glycosyltransferase involved in cell wall biosynthesis